MDQFSRLRNQFCDNLKLLSFKEFISKTNESFELKPDSFKKLSHNDFQAVTYFLFKTLNSEECKKRFKACFPVLDPKQGSDFRKIAYEWMQEIRDKETNSHFPRVVPIYFQNPSGEAFCHLYHEFSNYVMIKAIERTASSESIECHLIDLNDSESIQNQTQHHFNEYKKTKLEIQNVTQKWINETQYFVKSKDRLLQHIETEDQNKTQLFKKVEFKFGLNMNNISNEENVTLFLNELQTNVQKLKDCLIESNIEVNKKWNIYVNAFESQSNSSLHSIDLNHSFNKSTKDSFDSAVKNLISRITTYDTIIEKVQNKDLVEFIEVSSKLFNEAKIYKNQLIEILFKLKSMFNQLENLNEKKRSEFLKSAAIIERRKWFEERIPDLTRISIKIEPKENHLRANELITCVSDNYLKECEASDENRLLFGQQFNYSFKVMDISTCEYIPPSGSMEDSRLFSPLERNKQME